MIADIVSLDRARRLRTDHSIVERDVTQWKCRTMTRVGVTQTGVDTLAMFNAMLRVRRERPIQEHEVMICPCCLERWRP